MTTFAKIKVECPSCKTRFWVHELASFSNPHDEAVQHYLQNNKRTCPSCGYFSERYDFPVIKDDDDDEELELPPFLRRKKSKKEDKEVLDLPSFLRDDK